jgi:hypothetical protein
MLPVWQQRSKPAWPALGIESFDLRSPATPRYLVRKPLAVLGAFHASNQIKGGRRDTSGERTTQIAKTADATEPWPWLDYWQVAVSSSDIHRAPAMRGAHCSMRAVRPRH